MRLTLRLETAAGEQTVVVGPMAICGWEQEHRTKVSKLAETGIGMTDMTELAWRQLKLEGKDVGELDAWRATLLDMDPVVDDPTSLPAGA